MCETEYWLSLEHRLCREFAAMPHRRLQYLWCDGFLPSRYLLDDPQPRITGLAWIGNGPQEAVWSFTLHLLRPVEAVEEIDWSAMLPPENATGWLLLDEVQRRMEIEPACAVPIFASLIAVK